MKVKYILDQQKEELTEGLVFFRDSKRIKNLIKKLEEKKKDEPEIISFLENLTTLSNKFEILEKKYSEKNADKKTIKSEYEKLKSENQDVIRKINDETFRKTLKVVGISAAILTVVGSLSFLFFVNKDEFGFTPFTKLFSSFDSNLQEHIKNLSEQYKVPEHVIKAIINVESKWNVNAMGKNRNGTFDVGLMQLNSQYHDWYEEKYWDRKEKFNPFNPFHNVEIGIKLLADLRDRFRGSWNNAIKAYNIGAARVFDPDYSYNANRYLRIVLNQLPNRRV